MTKEGILAKVKQPKFIILVLSGLLVASLIVLFVLALRRPETEIEIDQEYITQQISEIFQNSNSADESIKKTDSLINAAKSDEEKAAMYSTRAKQLFYGHYTDSFDMILSDAHHAEELYPTFDTAYDIYMFAIYANNLEEAEKYKVIAEERNPVFRRANQLREEDS